MAAGVRHFDTAAEYGNEVELGRALRRWGGPRADVFVTTKLSNVDQSTDPRAVKRAVRESLRRLGLSYADAVLLHSPLTDEARRTASYGALLSLRDEGLCRSVGCANFGRRQLEELESAFGTAGTPQIVQLEVSPFNRHRPELEWCASRRVVLECASWSKLSGAYNWGSDSNFAALRGMCAAHSATKAQVLVAWAVQSGLVALPRSGVGSVAEKLAIAQNSGRGVSGREATWAGGPLTASEMAALDAMDERLPSGRLGRTDGWGAAEIAGPDWDPTVI